MTGIVSSLVTHIMKHLRTCFIEMVFILSSLFCKRNNDDGVASLEMSVQIPFVCSTMTSVILIEMAPALRLLGFLVDGEQG